ncbi:transglycosylase domain-containing protein (plasmid) [Leptospira sp. WS39.C2]
MNWDTLVQIVHRYSNLLLTFLKNKKEQIRYYLVRGFLFLILLFFVLTAYQTALFFYHKKSITHDLEQLKIGLSKNGISSMVPKQLVLIFDRNQNVIGKYNSGVSLTLTSKQCNDAKVFQQTLIASEDRDFLTHSGFSIKGMLRAFIQNLISFRIRQGGGTISQQLARNLFTDKSRNSINRKIYETIVALYLESILGKSEIICLYMNKAYFGQNSYGVEEASRYYFNKSVTKLTYAEASLLVGLLPAPSLYNPIRNPDIALKKQKTVMMSLVDIDVLTDKKAQKSLNEFRVFYQIKENDEENAHGTIAKNGTNRLFQVNEAPEINEYVLKYLNETIEGFHESEVNIKVYTSIDILKQKTSANILNSDIESLRWSFRNKASLSYNENKNYAAGINGVIFSIHPFTGEVLAVSGGTKNGDYYRNMVRSLYMRRQVGSTLKGFLYCVALEEGILEPNTILKDEPINISGYKPKNWYGKYLGDITIEQALQQSVNTVAVTVLKDLGISNYIDYLSNGLNLSYSDKSRFSKDLTLALGSADFSPLEVAILYSEIVNGGEIIEETIIRKIIANDEVIFESNQSSSSHKRLFNSKNTSTILHFLKSVFATGGTAAWIGKKQKQNSNYLSFDIAGKSGTVENDNANYKNIKGARDIWFVGITPEEITVVWFGHEKGVPIPGSGSSMAASTWAQYAHSAIHPNEKNRKFNLDFVPQPENPENPSNSTWDLPTAEGEKEPTDELIPYDKDREDSIPNEEKFYTAPVEKPKG